MNLNRLSFNRLNQWFNQRQLQVLDNAYKAAQEIQSLENQYFHGNKIAPTTEQGRVIYDYIKSQCDRQILRVRTNLAQFQFGGFFLDRQALSQDPIMNSAIEQEAVILEKLNFIETIVSKYRESEDELDDLLLKTNAPLPESSSLNSSKSESEKLSDQPVDSSTNLSKINPIQRRSDLFQGGLFGFRDELDPNYEQRVVQEIRIRQKQDKIAVRWLMILLLIPLLAQVVSKNLIFEPILGNYSDKNPSRIELNQEIKENLINEFYEFKQKLEIDELLGIIPELTVEQKQERLQEDAVELWREAREEELNGLKNICADGVALLMFTGLVYFNRSKITTIRNFSNRTFLSLNDPAKVFLFILITDMFVGFHSAEGWEVLLESVAHHFGLPESKAAINTFIATVPVILDSTIKFWIFSYLTRYSPSTSAIYERMNT